MPRRRSPRRRSSRSRASAASPTTLMRALQNHVSAVYRHAERVPAAGTANEAVNAHKAAKASLAEAEAAYLKLKAQGADFDQFRSLLRGAVDAVKGVEGTIEAIVDEHARQMDAGGRERNYGFDLTRGAPGVTTFADDDAYNANFEGFRGQRRRRCCR